MKTLREIIKEHEGLLDIGLISDFEIIEMYLSQDEILEKTPEFLTRLLTKQIECRNTYMRKVKDLIPMETGLYDYIKDDEIRHKFSLYTAKYIVEDPLREDEIEWCRKVIPTLKGKKYNFFYQPFYNYLNSLGIYFKDDKNKARKELEHESL